MRCLLLVTNVSSRSPPPCNAARPSPFKPARPQSTAASMKTINRTKTTTSHPQPPSFPSLPIVRAASCFRCSRRRAAPC